MVQPLRRAVWQPENSMSSFHMTWQLHSLQHLLQRNEDTIHTKTCPCVFTAALFATAENGEQPRCPLTGEWLNQVSTAAPGDTLGKGRNKPCVHAAPQVAANSTERLHTVGSICAPSWKCESLPGVTEKGGRGATRGNRTTPRQVGMFWVLSALCQHPSGDVFM